MKQVKVPHHKELGWQARIGLEESLRSTVKLSKPFKQAHQALKL
jgi:hypothetical protein